MLIIETCPKCGSDLREVVIDTYPPIHVKSCSKCGWQNEDVEEVLRIPFDEGVSVDSSDAEIPSFSSDCINLTINSQMNPRIVDHLAPTHIVSDTSTTRAIFNESLQNC